MHKRASSRNISVAQAMKLMLKQMLATNILVFGFAVPVAAGSLEDGRAAYEHRDFAIAERLFRPLAEQGNANAQYNLGVMYFKGEGVPQDYAQAALWYRKAAEQGYAEAQSAMGEAYYKGQGVPQDFAEAYFWLDLAAAGERDASIAKIDAEYRDRVASRLTPADLARVQERARKWFEAHQAKPGAPGSRPSFGR